MARTHGSTNMFKVIKLSSSKNTIKHLLLTKATNSNISKNR